MNYDLTESEWNTTGLPINSSFVFDWRYVKYIAIHWPGGNKWWRTFQEFLNRTQIQYQNGRGYSFGYSMAVDNDTGMTGEGRGLRFRAASNGDSENKDDTELDNPRLNDNMEVVSIIITQGSNEHLTEEAKAGVRKLVAQLRAIKPTLKIVGHGELDWSECPGPEIRAAISNGDFEPTQEEIDMTKANVLIVQFQGAQDQFLCTPMTGDNKERLGLLGIPPIRVLHGLTFEQLQAEAGYKLTPSPK